MLYGEKLEIREPLLVARLNVLDSPSVQRRVRRATRHVLMHVVKNPNTQYAITCEPRAISTKIQTLVLGQYNTSAEFEALPEGNNFFYRKTSEDGVLFNPEWTGSPDGLYAPHAMNYVDQLIANGARVMSALNIPSTQEIRASGPQPSYPKPVGPGGA